MTDETMQRLRAKLESLESFKFHTAGCYATYPEGKCNCRVKSDMKAILQALAAEIERAEVGAKQSLVAEFQTMAIPETSPYANGWNDCRKQVRADLNRLVAVQPKTGGTK